MKIQGTKDFQDVCTKKFVAWYNEHMNVEITEENVYVVNHSYILGSMKCQASCNVKGDGIYVEFTYNSHKEELYMDVYSKLENVCYR